MTSGKALIFRGRDAAIQQLLVEAGDNGQHDDDLRDVGGNQFLAELVGAIQQCGTGIDGFDDTLARRGARDFDAIAASQRAAFAARKTGEDFGTGKFDQILPAEGADDEAVMQAWLRAQRLFKPTANRRGAEDAEETLIVPRNQAENS